MQKDPLLSIVIATYNEEEHIERCINSLLDQDYTNVEIIITDDGSTDKTINIINLIAKDHSNVKLLKQKHLGMAQAWNNSANNSKGEIIMMFGADMFPAERSFIRKMIKPIKGGAIGSCHNKEIIANSNNLWARARCITFVGTDEQGRKFGIHPQTIYLAMRKDKWIEAGGADTRRGYDADQTFYDKFKVPPAKTTAALYHNHPASFKECWKQAIWIGSSMDKKSRIKLFLGLPILPLIILYKSWQVAKADLSPKFVLFLPLYHIIRFVGFYWGNLKYFVSGEKKR